MATVNCEDCETLRQNYPSVVTDGIGEDECTSLSNNTGLAPSSDRDDCEDLEMLNNCLIGNMEAELEKFDVCEWKEFMKEYIPNDFNTNKAIICAICGLWQNINEIWDCLNS